MSKIIYLPKLYKYTSKKQVQEWQIMVEGCSFYTKEGIKEGKLTTSLPTVCKGKNKGRSNETTPEDQAFKEAQAKWQKKIDSGYNEILSEEKKFFEPMLAHDLEKYEKLLFTIPTFIQPKLDGIRCILKRGELTTRNGKTIENCNHIKIHNYILDGELYNHELKNDFNKIVSLVRKTKPTIEDEIEAVEKIQYWVYDFPPIELPFSRRIKALETRFKEGDFPKYFRMVPTYEVKNLEEIQKYHEKFLGEGYEGSILRLDLGPYENKRSKQLLKKKDFIDEEFKIIGAEEGEGGRAGTIGYFIVDLGDGKTCKSNVKGDFDYLKEVWKDREKYIGTMATIKYFNKTPDGSLRFPYIIKLNRAEYE